VSIADFTCIDWAYLEDWCRRLTGSFSDVYVFTIPLYLPHKEADGKFRVVSLPRTPDLYYDDSYFEQTYEVIGSPPNVAVPTHFAKVVLASRPASPSTPDVHEVSTGAFVLPNAIIPDEAPLESFVIPGMHANHLNYCAKLMQFHSVDVVERAAGLNLFSDAVKAQSKHICKSTKCDVIVRRFDDAQKRPEMRRAISAPK
jgi:endonuclease G